MADPISIKKQEFKLFDFNKLDINDVTQYKLIDEYLTYGVKKLLPPDASPPEFSVFYTDSQDEVASESTSEFINLFISKQYTEDLLKVTNRDIAHLISFVKIARVPIRSNRMIYKEAIELTMATHYTQNSLESVIKDNYYSCGLSSLKIDVISNTGAFYNYRTSMSLYFQNASVLLNNDLYKQLLTVPTKDANSQPVAYTILLGWATPQINGDVPDSIKLLYHEKLALVLSLVTYNLSFNADGSVTLNLDFIGAAETQANSLSADVLVHKFTFLEEITDLENKIKENEEQLAALNSAWTSYTAGLANEINDLQRQLRETSDTQKQNDIKKTIDNLESQRSTDPKVSEDNASLQTIKKADEQLTERNSKAFHEAWLKDGKITPEYYSYRKKQLKSKIEESNNQIDYARYISIMRRMFYRASVYQGNLSFNSDLGINSRITFTPNFISGFENLSAETQKEFSKYALEWGATKNVLARLRKQQESTLGGTTNLTNAQKELTTVFASVSQGGGPPALAEARVLGGEGRVEYGSIYFKYFFLGDLVSVLTENMYSNMAVDQGDTSPMDSKKVVLCTFDVFNKDNQKKTMDLGYFPISYNYFVAWFLKNVVDQERKIYPFDKFIKDFMNDCVLGAIQQIDEWQNKFATFTKSSFSINKTYSDRTIELSYTDLPSLINNGVLKILPSDVREGFGGSRTAFVGDTDIKTEFYQYLFLNGQSSYVSKNGNYKDNLEAGIFHFFVGSTTGILKDVKFVPINNASRYANAIHNASAQHDGRPIDEKFNVIQRYDVNISCFGFQYFKPGQLIYVDTSLLGFGKSNELNSVARKFTLGGYYLVTNVSHNLEAGDFTTNIVAKFESYGK